MGEDLVIKILCCGSFYVNEGRNQAVSELMMKYFMGSHVADE